MSHKHFTRINATCLPRVLEGHLVSSRLHLCALSLCCVLTEPQSPPSELLNPRGSWGPQHHRYSICSAALPTLSSSSVDQLLAQQLVLSESPAFLLFSWSTVSEPGRPVKGTKFDSHPGSSCKEVWGERAQVPAWQPGPQRCDWWFSGSPCVCLLFPWRFVLRGFSLFFLTSLCTPHLALSSGVWAWGYGYFFVPLFIFNHSSSQILLFYPPGQQTLFSGQTSAGSMSTLERLRGGLDSLMGPRASIPGPTGLSVSLSSKVGRPRTVQVHSSGSCCLDLPWDPIHHWLRSSNQGLRWCIGSSLKD